MASTTTAAVSFLKSTSSSSSSIHADLGTSSAATNNNLHGLNLGPTNNSRLTHPYLFSKYTTISTSQSHPTITLDLTAPSSSSSYPHFNKLASTLLNPTSPPKYPPTSLSFSSSSSSFSSSSTLSMPSSSSSSFYSLDSSSSKNSLGPFWGNGYLSFGTQSYKRNQIIGQSSYVGGRQLANQEVAFYKSTKPSEESEQQQQQPIMRRETVAAAATRAITSNPTFQSALAAAITSYLGNPNSGIGENHDLEKENS